MDDTQVSLNQMDKFTKWVTILPELRKHAMTYFEGETQFNYAQCSKLCHKEIQTVDRAIPDSLLLQDLNCESHGLSIKMMLYDESLNKWQQIIMDFIDVATNKHKWIVHPSSKYVRENDRTVEKHSTRVYQADENSTYDGTAMEGAANFLKQRCKRSISKRFVIHMLMHSWPIELSSMLTHFYKSMWMIEIDETSYPGFMEFMSNAPAEMKIRFDNDGGNPFCLPSAFLETDLFKNIRILESYIPIVITEEQFLNSNAQILSLMMSTMSSRAFHQKLRNWFDDPDDGHKEFQIYLPEDSSDVFDINVIIGDLPFTPIPREGADSEFGLTSYITAKINGTKGYLGLTTNFASFAVCK